MERYLNAKSHGQGGSSPMLMRCPICHRNGTFETLNINDIRLHENGTVTDVGHRRCPNPECFAHLFVVVDASSSRVVTSYPPEVIDFDATNVPSKVVDALEEAITCHANECYIAAAIMVRKTLEELCADRGAKGGNLKDRIKALGAKVVLPPELLDGLDDLRLLGNDAAHIESNVYDKIGREEVEVGIEFTKEVLKGVFQMSDLLARLRGLRATQEP